MQQEDPNNLIVPGEARYRNDAPSQLPNSGESGREQRMYLLCSAQERDHRRHCGYTSVHRYFK
jgi:hypothetical protein